MEKLPAIDCIYEAFNAYTRAERYSVNISLRRMSYQELNTFVKECAKVIGKKAVGFVDPLKIEDY